MADDDYQILEKTLASAGPAAGMDSLVSIFEGRKDYHRAFDALTMKARLKMGLPLMQTASGVDVPEALRKPYEDELVAACRQVGQWFLDAGDVPNAFQYFRMIGETAPIREAIEKYQPTGDAHDDGIMELAISHGVHPEKGIAMVASRYGLCQAITSCEGLFHQQIPAAAREGCIRTLVRAIHAELVARLKYEVAEREGKIPEGGLSDLLAGRDWLFENENYHIDTSHLNAIVRMARMLSDGPEIDQAIELCDYGTRLSERYRFPEAPPFDDVFTDSKVYLETLAGKNVDQGLDYFLAKVKNCDPAEAGTFPAEVAVNLLVRCGRIEQALDFASTHLANPNERLSCPSIIELCERLGDYRRMACLAQHSGDLLHFAAARILAAGG